MTKEEWLSKTNTKYIKYTALWNANIHPILKVKMHYEHFLIDKINKYAFAIAFGK